MRMQIEVREADGTFRRRDTMDAPIADPPAASDRRELAALVAMAVLESHDLDISVRVDGVRLEIETPHAHVVATLPAPLDRLQVREVVESLGLRWTA
jgi:hypothetical protein